MSRARPCKRCGASLLFVKMQGTGKMMPVDADSVRSYVVLNGNMTQGAVRKCGVSHFETCPAAPEFRKKK